MLIIISLAKTRLVYVLSKQTIHLKKRFVKFFFKNLSPKTTNKTPQTNLTKSKKGINSKK